MKRKSFSGFENLILTYDELKEIVENPTVYEAWHTALSSVNAIYLIVTGRRENSMWDRLMEKMDCWGGGPAMWIPCTAIIS